MSEASVVTPVILLLNRGEIFQCVIDESHEKEWSDRSVVYSRFARGSVTCGRAFDESGLTIEYYNHQVRTGTG